MDIRNFFGKKGRTTKSIATTKKKPKDSASSSREPTPLRAPASVAPAPTTKKRKIIVIDDHDDDSEDEQDCLVVDTSSVSIANRKTPTPRRDGKASTPGKMPNETPIQNTATIIHTSNRTSPRNVKSDVKGDCSTPPSAVPDSRDSSNKKPRYSAGTTAASKRGAADDHDCDSDNESMDMNPRPLDKETPRTARLKRARQPRDPDRRDNNDGNTPNTKTSTATPKKKSIPKQLPGKIEQLLDPSEIVIEELASFPSSSAVPECLAGLTFVFSGILDTLGREESVDYVKDLGGRVTGAVSSKTSYLVVGDLLEDGRSFGEGSKYKKASDIGVRVIQGERQLYGLCKLYSDKTRAALGDDTIADVVSSRNDKSSHGNCCNEGEAPMLGSSQSTASIPSPQISAPKVNPYAKPINPYAKAASSSAILNPYASSKAGTRATVTAIASQPSSTPSAPGDPNALWADKYAPASTADILGNQDSVKKLQNWLTNWERSFNNDKAYGKSFSSPNGPWKAALLSGPPGIGKTTTATLCAKEAGRVLLEMNASDARSKKTLSVALGDVTGSQVIQFSVGKVNPQNGGGHQKRCLIMDEVDGMGAGDRGGMAELISVIKASRIPIICICNDRQSQKMKSLLPYCLDLRYKRPVKSVIARRVLRIGEAEGMKIEQNAVEAIAESCGNDIRQVLNCLQMWSTSKAGGKSVTYRDLRARESSISKDAIQRVSMFDATKQIIEGRRGLSGADRKAAKDSLYKRSDAFFVDYSFMGINVHQNYLKVMVGGYQDAVRSKDDDKMDSFVERMHDATLSMSDFAAVEQAVRGGDMNWSLLPFLSMTCVKTGYHAGGENGGFLGGFPEFAGWMGKNSTRGKKHRLLNELGYHMNYKVSTDKADLRLHYLPVLRARFMELLYEGDKTKLGEAIVLMDNYGIDRTDLFENIDEFKMDSKAKGFNDIDSKQKAAFTREYNQVSHKSQALVHEQGAGKVSRTSKNSSTADPVGLDVVNDDRVDESDDDEEEELSEEKLKLLFGKKTRSKGRGGSSEIGTKKAKAPKPRKSK